jgi:hypothetical protein
MATDKDKLERAAELQKAIDAAARKKDANIDPGTERAAGGSSGEHLDKILTHLDDCIKRLDARLDAMSKRLGDAMDDDARRRRDDDESRRRKDARRGKDDDDETEEEERLRREEEGREPGEAREVVADTDARRRIALADAQQRADACAAAWGGRADAPLVGESVRAYRCRQLRRYQRHSKKFAKSDLETISDPNVFGEIEASIYADATAAASDPDSVPAGTLRMISKKMPTGHTEITFVGSPHAWMSQFSRGRSRFVTKINPKANDT